MSEIMIRESPRCIKSLYNRLIPNFIFFDNIFDERSFSQHTRDWNKMAVVVMMSGNFWEFLRQSFVHVEKVLPPSHQNNNKQARKSRATKFVCLSTYSFCCCLSTLHHRCCFLYVFCFVFICSEWILLCWQKFLLFSFVHLNLHSLVEVFVKDKSVIKGEASAPWCLSLQN